MKKHNAVYPPLFNTKKKEMKAESIKIMIPPS